MHFFRTGFGRENSFAIATWQQKSQIITNRTIQTADLVRFRGFSPQMCHKCVTPTAFILALFPGACAFAYDRGVRFPAFFQLTSFLIFFCTGQHTSLLFVGLVFGRLVTSRRSVSINEFFNKAFMRFVCMSVTSLRRIENDKNDSCAVVTGIKSAYQIRPETRLHWLLFWCKATWVFEFLFKITFMY